MSEAVTGSLSQADLLADHKAVLSNASGKFAAPEDGDYKRHLNNAALALSRFRRRTLVATLTLVAEQADYDAPTDIVATKVSDWGQGKLLFWDVHYARLPRLSLFEGESGLKVHLNPAPTSTQISLFGRHYAYFYLAAHAVGESSAQTTFNASDRDLFLLLALIEAMKELAAKNVIQPIQLHKGMGGMPANSTPSALVELLTRQVELMR